MLQLAIVNGPNMNLLGTREQDIYGNQSFESWLEVLQQRYADVQLHYYQSNVEGELVNYLQSCEGKMDGIILNAAAYSHTSVAIRDAIAAIKTPVVEVHISNVHAREDFRKTLLTAAKCVGTISGLGLEGYALAILYFKTLGAKTT